MDKKKKVNNDSLYFTNTLIQIVLPSLLLVVLLSLIMFGVLLPFLERKTIEYNNNICQNLVSLVLSDLEAFNNDVLDGSIDLEEAQEKALEHLRNFRFGKEKANYFWITDTNLNYIHMSFYYIL